MKPLTPIRDRDAYIAAAEVHTLAAGRRTKLIFCAGKEPYESRTVAEQVSRRRARKGKPSDVYKCNGCGKYHLGEGRR